MRKYFLGILAGLLFLFSVLPTVQPLTVKAETKYAVGEHNLPMQVWKESEDSKSVADGYLDGKTSKLIVEENGDMYVVATLNNSSWWQYFKVQTSQPGSFDDGNFTDVQVLSEDSSNDTRVVKFKVQDLDQTLNAKIHVIVTGIPGFNYDNKYNIRLKFDASEVPPAKDPGTENPETEDPETENPGAEDPETENPGSEDPETENSGTEDPETENPGTEDPETENPGTEDPETEDPGSEDPETENPGTEDPETGTPDKGETKYVVGTHDLPFTILKDTTDEPSMTNDYMKSPGKLIVEENGDMFAVVTLNNSSWWQYLKVQTSQPGSFSDSNFEDAEVLSEDKTSDTRIVKFKVQDIEQILNAKIHVIVPMINYDNKYDIRFQFDASEVPLAEETEEPGTEEPGTEEPGTEEPGKGETKYAVGMHDLPFTILKDTTNEPSMTNDYMKSPGKLIVEEDGDMFAVVTLNNSSWWQYLKVQSEQPGSFSDSNFEDAEVLSEDKTSDTRIVKFKVQDIEQILNAKIHVIVPMINYDNKYDIRFQFDASEVPLAGETEEPADNLEEGKVYSIDFKIDGIGEETKEIIAKHIKKDAIVSVNNGLREVQLILEDQSKVGSFQYEVNDEFIAAKTIEIDEEADTKTVALTVDTLTSNVKVKMTISNNVATQRLSTFNLLSNSDTVEYEFNLTFENAQEIEPGIEEPGTEEPGIEEPGTEEPGIEEPGTEEPGIEEPGTEEPGIEEPGIEEPGTEEPGTEEPGTEEPGTEEPGIEEPGKGETKYAVGTHDLPFTILKDTTNELSMTNDYMKSPAKLIVEGNGDMFAVVTLNNSSWWKYLKVQTTQPGSFTDSNFEDAEVISEDTSSNSSIVKFKVQDIEQILNAKIHVIVPMINYDNKYDIRFQFDASEVPLAEETEEPGTEEPGTEEPGTEEPSTEEPGTEEPSTEEPGTEEPGIEEPGKGKTKYVVGEHKLPIQVLKESENSKSVADNYLDGKNSKLIVEENGDMYVVTILKNSSWWQYFKVQTSQPGTFKENNFKDVQVLSEDKGADTRIVKFKVQDIEQTLNAKVHVIVTGIPGFSYDNKYNIRLKFDASKVPLTGEQEPQKPGTEKPDTEKPDTEKPDTEKPDKENPGTKNPGTDKIDPRNLKDGEYSIEFSVLKKNSKELSMMNDYVVSPGSLKVKDGKMYVAVTLKNSSWITDFKVEKGGSLSSPKLLNVEEAADRRTVEFEVADLFSILDAWVKVDIPELSYHNEYDVHFSFDTDSIKLLKAGDYPKNDDHAVVPPKSGQKDPKSNDQGDKSDHTDKLGFDRNGDKISKTAQTDKQDVNPKTSDTTKMILFALLFILSLVPLIMKVRRQRNLQ